MWTSTKNLVAIAGIVLLFVVIGVAASHHFRLAPALAQEPGPGDGVSPVPADQILSSSTAAGMPGWELQLTIGRSATQIMPVGSSVELYLENDYPGAGCHTAASLDVYFVADQSDDSSNSGNWRPRLCHQ